jgi:hypothetical protein
LLTAEAPTTPTAGPRASAVSKAKGAPSAPNAAARRGGYNVVAD